MDDGWLVMPGMVGGEVVGAAHEHLASLPATGPLVTGPVEGFFAEVAALLRIFAANLLGRRAEVFGATYVVKPARSDLVALWHQDGPGWIDRLGGRDAVTAWVALDEATSASGCLRVIPGSHRGGLHALVPVSSPPNLFGVALPPSVPVDEAAAVDVELAPGDVSWHHPALVHASGPNRTASPRRALAVRFAARG